MKVAILTNFTEINHGYSLTGIVEDQVRMLSDYGHDVHLFVNEVFVSPPLPGSVRPVIPQADLTDYQSIGDVTDDHQAYAAGLADLLARELAGFDFALTHDWVFTGWNLPYALAVRQASKKLPGLSWLHWIHSIPTAGRDWWRIRDYGPGHRLVYPNESDRLRAVEQYHGVPADVMVIPHIKDPRTWFDFSDETNLFIKDRPAALQAEIVQVLPASSDRLSAKRLDVVVKIFGCFKRRGISVCLIVANQWATGRQSRERLGHYLRMAETAGLEPGVDFFFTSRAGYETGLPRRILRELFQLSNLFIFPTREETFGLAVPEAAAAGVLPVLNRSLAAHQELFGPEGPAVEFGSYERNVHHADEDAWLGAVAAVIIGEMRRDRAVQFKTHCRRRFNRDAVYRDYYEPLLARRSAG